MSAAKSEAVASADNNLYRIRPGGPWSNAWKISAAVGAVGIVLALVGFASDARRFAFSYLFAFMAFLTLALGSLFFVLIQYLTGAGWSVTVRRTAEFFMAALPVFALLFIPVYLSKSELYPWINAHAEQHGGNSPGMGAHEGSGGHGSEAGEVGGTRPGPSDAAHAEVGSTDVSPIGPSARSVPVEMEQHHILAKKQGYLNLGFFTIRAVIYFLVWFLISRRLFKLSTDQDVSRDPKNTAAAQRLAPGATFLFGLTLTFAAFDWVMSLNPLWYSTIFGVWIFAGAAVTIHSTLIVVTAMMRSRGLFGRAVNVEHDHDLGKLSFGFTVFWAYISFSQFFLIWYASIPEETVFYHHRWGNSPWVVVSLALFFGHFVLPFLVLLSRNAKRRAHVLPYAAAIIPIMHIVEAYWIVLPNYGRNVFETVHQSYFMPHWLDFACLLGVGGVYFAVVFYLMTRYPLIPLGDPRLPRALRFENA